MPSASALLYPPHTAILLPPDEVIEGAHRKHHYRPLQYPLPGVRPIFPRQAQPPSCFSANGNPLVSDGATALEQAIVLRRCYTAVDHPRRVLSSSLQLSPASLSAPVRSLTLVETLEGEDDEDDSSRDSSDSHTFHSTTMSPDTAPSSPPGLYSSRSSTKSSSLAHDAETFGQPSDFEDIALHDTDANSHTRSAVQQRALTRTQTTPAPKSHGLGNGSLATPGSRPGLSAVAGRRPSPGPSMGMRSTSSSNIRPLASSSASSSPGTFSAPSTSTHPRHIPFRPSPQHARTWHHRPSFAASSPSLSVPNGHHGRRPSPSRRVSSNLDDPIPTLPLHKPRSGPPSRRGSWQPNRKTAKELEDEYHDSDEEIPEDAVVWNIPLSPRPLHARAQSASPGRRSPLHRHTNAASTADPHADDIASPPPPRQTRTKSWTEALNDLSDEAQILTSELESHSDLRLENQASSGKTSLKDSPPRPTVHKARSQSVLLPPVRVSDPLIDPLPPSKEKEKVMSRTRPSWLPPKSAKEERRHLKEYQQMMSTSLEAERRRAVREDKARTARETEMSRHARIWEEHVLPNWDTAIAEPRTRELWWQGVAPRSRGEVWKRAVGNELHLTAASYTAALARAHALEQKYANVATHDQPDLRELAWFAAIRTDADTVFPSLKIFQAADGPLHTALVDVLCAYAMYRSDVGYVQGAHLPAALLLLNMSAADAFITLANLLNRPTPLAAYLRDPAALAHSYRLIQHALAYKLPSLHAHLTDPSVGLAANPGVYLDPLLRSLFVHGLSVDVASRVWDVYVFEGENALVRAAVAVFARLEGSLYGSAEEVAAVLGWNGKDENGLLGVGSEEEVMAAMRWAGKAEVKDED